MRQVVVPTGLGHDPYPVRGTNVTNSGWNYILKDRVGGVSEPGIRVGGVDYFTSAIGLHASEGITFDLDELRARHGDAAVEKRFTVVLR